MSFDIIIGMINLGPQYVVPTSNFTVPRGDSKPAYLIGIPCKIISDVYKVKRWGDETEDVIDVESTVTGLKYTVPIDWVDFYRTLVEANDHAYMIGHHFPSVNDLIGKPYWPRDNSYISDFAGNCKDLYHHKCEIVSAPFRDSIKSDIDHSQTDYDFILVRYDGKIYRTLFQEWGLYEP